MTQKKPLMRSAEEYPLITVAQLHAHAVEVDGCLVWRNQCKSGPVINIARRQWKVRHLVWFALRGWVPPSDRLPMPTVCNNPACIHPDHLSLVKRNAHARGKKRTLTHRANIARVKREQTGKLTMEKARAIRAAIGTLTEIARAHGVSIPMAYKIRANLAWVDHSNPYLQLAAS